MYSLVTLVYPQVYTDRPEVMEPCVVVCESAAVREASGAPSGRNHTSVLNVE